MSVDLVGGLVLHRVSGAGVEAEAARQAECGTNMSGAFRRCGEPKPSTSSSIPRTASTGTLWLIICSATAHLCVLVFSDILWSTFKACAASRSKWFMILACGPIEHNLVQHD
jgi:hypothetical protein